MSAEFPTLAEVLAECGCDRTAQHAIRAADAWREVCTIRTVEQIKELPLLALIREIYGPSPGSGNDYGGVYERRSDGWTSISGTYSDPARNGTPRLPALLIWHPGWEKP